MANIVAIVLTLKSKVVAAPPATTPSADLTGGTNPDVVNFIQKQEEYIEQLERESQYCRVSWKSMYLDLASRDLM